MGRIKEKLKREFSCLPTLSKIKIYRRIYHEKSPLLLGAWEWTRARLGCAGHEPAHDLFVDYAHDGQVYGADAILEVLMDFDVVSFDLFDTVFLRRVERPTDIFRFIEQHLAIDGFAQQRERAEWAARQAKHRRTASWEITFEEIYDALPQFTAEQKRELRQIELAIEAEQLTINPVMRRVAEGLQEKGKRIIAISDMYLSAQVLKEFLKGCAFPLTEEIFVSSQFGVSKSDGRLFEAVAGLESLRRQSIVHIGDNFHSDVHMGKKAAKKAIHYIKQ